MEIMGSGHVIGFVVVVVVIAALIAGYVNESQMPTSGPSTTLPATTVFFTFAPPLLPVILSRVLE